MDRVSIIIPTARGREVVEPCLRSIAQQDYDPSLIEVLPVYNGPVDPPDWSAADFPFRLVVSRLESANIAAAKNVALAQARGDWLILLNDDVRPEPEFVRAHLRAHATVERPSMVLGRSDWRRYPDQTVFDELIQNTSMIFFYDRTQPHQFHGFRHAWNLNLSLARRDLDGARFDERLGPFFFEDVELAWRLETRAGLRVWYAPEAGALHDHRYDAAGYFERERRLGAAALRLWRCNPECFRAVYHGDNPDRLAAYYDEYLRRESSGLAERLVHFQTLAGASAASLPTNPQLRRDWLCVLYDAHLPLKRAEFRRGFCEAHRRVAPRAAQVDAGEALLRFVADEAVSAESVSAV